MAAVPGPPLSQRREAGPQLRVRNRAAVAAAAAGVVVAAAAPTRRVGRV
eukprot:gene44615-59348_t